MGSKNQTATTTSSPNPAAMDAYSSILGKSNALANTTFQPYGGTLVPDVNAQQNLGINSINANANFASPYIQNAAGLAQLAATPLTSQQIQQYVNPYTQNVVNSTEAQFQNQNAQQLQGVKGNAIAQGALGGNREAVAEAETTNQQNLAQAPVIAGLESQGYQTGLNTALAEQQAQAQGAYSLGNLGVSGQNAALTGANAQVGAGNLQYGVASAQDQAAYQQYLNQQAFPYQQLQYLAGIDTGVGSQLGGTSTTTSPGPNIWSQILGLGTAAAGTAGKIATSARGGRIHGYASGGSPYEVSGSPYSGGVGYIPSAIPISHGRGIPPAPGIGGQGNQSGVSAGLGSAGSSFGDLGVAAKNLYNGYNANGSISGAQNVAMGQGAGVGFDINGDPLSGNKRGGRIGYDAGGSVDQNWMVPISTGTADYTPDNRMNLGLAAGINYASALSPEMIQQYTADMIHKYGPQWQQMRAPAMTAYTKGYADGGAPIMTAEGLATIPDWLSTSQYQPSPSIVPSAPASHDGGIDASDIVMNGGSGGLGLGATPDWSPEQDAAVTNRGVASPAPSYTNTGPSADYAGVDNPDSAYNRSLVSGDTAAPTGVAYEHPHTDPWGAVIAAGLGMMASRSPFVGTAIGEGGLAGLREYSTEQARDISEAEKKASIGLESQRLDQAAKQAQARLNLETEAQQHGTWYQQQEAMKPVVVRQDIDPLGRVHTVYGLKQPDGTFVDPTTHAPIETPSNVGAGPVQIAQAGPGGEELLNTLPSQVKNTVLGLVNGDIDIGKVGYRDRTALMNLATAYDPSYNTFTAPQRAQAAKNYTGTGVEARNFTSNDMAIKHIASGLGNIEAMGNFTYFPGIANAVRGTIKENTDPQYQQARTNLGVDIDAVSNELMRSFRGTGSASEKEAEEWRSKFPIDGSPVQQRAAFAQAANLLAGRITAAGNRYNDAMGPLHARDPLSWLSPEGQKIIKFTTTMDPQKPVPPNFNETIKGSGQQAQTGQTFTGRTATGPNGAKLRETADGQWVP